MNPSFHCTEQMADDGVVWVDRVAHGGGGVMYGQWAVMDMLWTQVYFIECTEIPEIWLLAFIESIQITVSFPIYVTIFCWCIHEMHHLDLHHLESLLAQEDILILLYQGPKEGLSCISQFEMINY